MSLHRTKNTLQNWENKHTCLLPYSQTHKMGWSLISKAEHLLRHDPEWEQVTEKRALHGPIIKEKHMNKM